jgi:flagellin
MALTVATNTGALMAQAAASSVNKEMEISMERLSTGKRINGASDDAAGVAIASRLTAEIRGTNQAIRNAMDGQALIDTAEGAHVEVADILQRMRELAVQSANDTNSATDRASIQNEINALTAEIDRISQTTSWAGQKLLTGAGGNSSDGTFNIHVGSKTSTNDSIVATIKNISSTSLNVSGDGTDTIFTTTAAGGTASGTTGKFTFTEGTGGGSSPDFIQIASSNGTGIASKVVIAGVDVAYTVATDNGGLNKAAQDVADIINENATLNGLGFVATVGTTAGSVVVSKGGASVSSVSAAKATINNIDKALATIATQRSNLGSISNRLDSTVSNLTNISSNLQAGKGRIEDADFAAETTNLAKSQILQQASTAMLAQANASKQNVLSLLQG